MNDEKTKASIEKRRKYLLSIGAKLVEGSEDCYEVPCHVDEEAMAKLADEMIKKSKAEEQKRRIKYRHKRLCPFWPYSPFEYPYKARG